MKRVLILILCVVIMTTFFFAGCKKDGDTGGETTRVAREIGGTLTVGIVEASGNFNPVYYSSAYDGYVVDLVFEGLIDLNFDGEYEGIVAESWEYSNEGKTITFKLKQDRVFSDNTPLTAHDIEFTYYVLADPSYTGRYGSVVTDMLGYEEFFAGETTTFEGVKAIDDYTVEFNFKEALRPNFVNCGFSIMPKNYYGKDYTIGNTSSIEALSSDPVGSGPYKVAQFADKELVYLVRSETYADKTSYAIEEIILKFVDQTTDIIELTTGSVDLLAGQIEPKKISEARTAGFEINEYQRSGYGYIKTNCEWGPTTDPVVRQALYYSFNVNEFVNSFYFDADTDTVLASTQYHPFSQVSWAIDDEILSEMIEYDFDLDKARELLDQAGWTLNAQGQREKEGQLLELNIAAMPDHSILETLIPMWERDWGQGLGIKLNVAYLEFNTLLDYIIYDSDANVDKWSLFFLATSITSADPHSLYSTFHSDYIGSGQNNMSRYSNSEIDRLFDEGKTIMDIDEAKPIYKQIAKILNEDAAMMPVYANTYFDLYHSKLKNFNTSSLYNWVAAMRDAYVEE